MRHLAVFCKSRVARSERFHGGYPPRREGRGFFWGRITKPWVCSNLTTYEQNLNFCYFLLLFLAFAFTKPVGFSIIFVKFSEVQRRLPYGARFFPSERSLRDAALETAGGPDAAGGALSLSAGGLRQGRGGTVSFCLCGPGPCDAGPHLCAGDHGPDDFGPPL